MGMDSRPSKRHDTAATSLAPDKAGVGFGGPSLSHVLNLGFSVRLIYYPWGLSLQSSNRELPTWTVGTCVEMIERSIGQGFNLKTMFYLPLVIKGWAMDGWPSFCTVLYSTIFTV